MESEAYDLEGNNMWFKQGKFPINLHGEIEGELMDGNGIKVTTLMDIGCSKPILNKRSQVRFPVEESDFFSKWHQTVSDIYFHIYVQAV